MPPPAHWLTRPPVSLPDDWRERCRLACAAPACPTPPAGLPLWIFLQWLADERGLLLHGSQRPGIRRFEPRTPNDKSPDEFSKQTAVYASSDALWAMFYALTLGYPGRNMLNAALQDRDGQGWGPMRYFFSLSHGPDFPFGPGTVYLLPRAGFSRMPPYGWPGVGEVLEPQWASVEGVEPVASIPVVPADFPLLQQVRRHDNDAVQVRAQADPWAFPWLD